MQEKAFEQQKKVKAQLPSHFRKHLYTNELTTPGIRPIIKFCKNPKKNVRKY